MRQPDSKTAKYEPGQNTGYLRIAFKVECSYGIRFKEKLPLKTGI